MQLREGIPWLSSVPTLPVAQARTPGPMWLLELTNLLSAWLLVPTLPRRARRTTSSAVARRIRTSNSRYSTLGNHDYYSGNVNGVWDYWGDRGGPRGLGYYSFDVGAWHIIVLNSNVSYVPSSVGSAQDTWLEHDLAADTKKCTLAAFHQPRFFSSDTPGWTTDGSVEPFWNRLYAANADLVLNGQQHQYERLAPMTPDGALDQVRGIRSIHVRTGGESTALPVAIHPNSEVISDAFGVLKLTLYADRYTWEFVPMPGETFSDQGSGTCH